MSSPVPFKDRPQEEQDKMQRALEDVASLGSQLYQYNRDIKGLKKRRDEVSVRYHAARDEFYACIGKPNPNPQEVPNA
tara:strand:- start:3691 stop:3924 length:234 start_codon:yes stop_codon:yes gene_type:complete